MTVIGYEWITRLCIPCGKRKDADLYATPIKEGEDFGVPYECDGCGEDIRKEPNASNRH